MGWNRPLVRLIWPRSTANTPIWQVTLDSSSTVVLTDPSAMSRCAPGHGSPWPLSTDLMVKYIANRAAKNISSEESQMMVPTLTRFGLLAGVRGLVWTVAVATRPLLRQPVGDRYATPRIGCRSRYDACHEGRCVQPRRGRARPDQARHRASSRDGRAGRGDNRGRHPGCAAPATRRRWRRRDAAGRRTRRRRVARHLVRRRRRDQPPGRPDRAGPRTGRPDAGPCRSQLTALTLSFLSRTDHRSSFRNLFFSPKPTPFLP